MEYDFVVTKVLGINLNQVINAPSMSRFYYLACWNFRVMFEETSEKSRICSFWSSRIAPFRQHVSAARTASAQLHLYA
jgi:hypothetical protein